MYPLRKLPYGRVSHFTETELLNLLRARYLKLPSTFRFALELHYYFQFPNEHVAFLLETTEYGVKKRVYCAKALLLLDFPVSLNNYQSDLVAKRHFHHTLKQIVFDHLYMDSKKIYWNWLFENEIDFILISKFTLFQ